MLLPQTAGYALRAALRIAARDRPVQLRDFHEATTVADVLPAVSSSRGT